MAPCVHVAPDVSLLWGRLDLSCRHLLDGLLGDGWPGQSLGLLSRLPLVTGCRLGDAADWFAFEHVLGPLDRPVGGDMSRLALVELVSATAKAEVLLEFCISGRLAHEHFTLLTLRHDKLISLSAGLFSFELLELAKLLLTLALLLLARLVHLRSLDGGESSRFLTVSFGKFCLLGRLLLFDLSESLLLLALLSFLRLTYGDLLAASDSVKS